MGGGSGRGKGDEGGTILEQEHQHTVSDWKQWGTLWSTLCRHQARMPLLVSLVPRREVLKFIHYSASKRESYGVNNSCSGLKGRRW